MKYETIDIIAAMQEKEKLDKERHEELIKKLDETVEAVKVRAVSNRMSQPQKQPIIQERVEERKSLNPFVKKRRTETEEEYEDDEDEQDDSDDIEEAEGTKL